MTYTLQTLVDAMSEAERASRANYHVTLGKLIKILADERATGNVRYDGDGNSAPGTEDSYRGYYSDLAFDTQQKLVFVADFLKQCRNALGRTYVGYKGGDFTMASDTPLWRASYGCCGEAIVRATIESNGDVVLHCLDVDD